MLPVPLLLIPTFLTSCHLIYHFHPTLCLLLLCAHSTFHTCPGFLPLPYMVLLGSLLACRLHLDAAAHGNPLPLPHLHCRGRQSSSPSRTHLTRLSYWEANLDLLESSLMGMAPARVAEQSPQGHFLPFFSSSQLCLTALYPLQFSALFSADVTDRRTWTPTWTADVVAGSCNSLAAFSSNERQPGL